MTTAQAHSSVDAATLRAAMRSFATGVTVVTTAGDGEPSGVTANAFSALSLTPPLVLVCLSATSSTLRDIAANGVFAVNVLAERQEALSRGFASRDRPRGRAAFSDVSHRTAVTGAPIVEGVACWLDCRVAALHGAGDHVIAIGEVLALDCDRRRAPLVFHAGRYRVVRDRGDAAPASSLFSDIDERR